MHQPALLAALTASLAALPAVHAGLYTKNSPVLQLSGRSYDRLIAKSNYTSIIEFYAPWCGHCQKLKPEYEKAARNLEGLAKVAAVDCDDESNKPFCGSMGVQGFPTLKIVRPGKKPGRPVVEDFQGARTASAMVEAVVSKMSNHVRRLTDKELDGFLAADADRPKALLFSEKGTTSALLKSIAIDFLGALDVGQVRSKETAASRFGITAFPALVLIAAGDKEPVVYDGDLNKKDMVAFLRQAAEPNPDPAPTAAKKSSSSSSSSSKRSSTSTVSQQPPEPSTTEETSTSTAAAASLIDIPSITSKAQLEEHCLQSDAHTCLVALVPAAHSESKEKALHSLSQIYTKYMHARRHNLPFFSIATDVDGSAHLREALDISHEVEIIAVNARRAWWRRYDGDLGPHSVEAWLDAVRMGEGEKRKLPRDIIVEAKTQTETETEPEPEPEAEPAAEPEAEPEASETGHDEL